MVTALYPEVISEEGAVFLFFSVSGFAVACGVKPQVIVNEIMAGTLSNQGIRMTGMIRSGSFRAGIIVRMFTNLAESFPFVNSENPASHRGETFQFPELFRQFPKTMPGVVRPGPGSIPAVIMQAKKGRGLVLSPR